MQIGCVRFTMCRSSATTRTILFILWRMCLLVQPPDVSLLFDWKPTQLVAMTHGLIQDVPRQMPDAHK